jgi:hypothetical protein
MPVDHQDSAERVAITTTTRALLCLFAAGDVSRRLVQVSADWQEVFPAVVREGLLGLAYHHLNMQQAAGDPPLAFREAVQRTYRFGAIQMVQVYRNIGQVLTVLQQANLDYLIVKGPALAKMVYPIPALRFFSDLDIVVRERDWNVTHRALVSMGFVSETDWSQPPPKFAPQVVIYEQRYWHAAMGLVVEVHYDDLLNAGLSSRDVAGFWQRAVAVNVGEVTAKTLSLEDTLIHLCAHAHYHGYTRLSWLSDIAFIIRDHAARLSWSRVMEVVRREEVQVSVYYTLRLLPALLDVSVPEDVLLALQPDRLRRWMHEMLLPESQVLALQPMWRPDFSFYFIPLFKRLLPDLLVMGRRKEKLYCLLRLLVPPRAWLCHYYGLLDTSWPIMHYVLHPLKLLGHYLGELLSLFSSRSPRECTKGANTAP